MSTVVVVMGVSGCGKTTIGQGLAEYLDCPFYDGDNFHPPENIAKMSSGTPLNDDDREPWLRRLHSMITDHLARDETAVIACSALKKKYRNLLRGNIKGVLFIYLKGNFDLIWQRMTARQGHYMRAEMLQSQFAALEEPDNDEGFAIDIACDIKTQIEMIVNLLEIKK